MKETSYRVDPKPALKSCAKCGRPTDPQRLVYSKTGDLICAACESGADGDERIVRGAWGSVGAAITFGFAGTIALLLLLQSLVATLESLPSSSGEMRFSARFSAMWWAFLALIVLLGGGSIAGAHRTLSSPAVRKVIGPKRTLMLWLSWAGIPLVPGLAVLYVAFVAVLTMIIR